jgi:hypothetical protein
MGLKKYLCPRGSDTLNFRTQIWWAGKPRDTLAWRKMAIKMRRERPNQRLDRSGKRQEQNIYEPDASPAVRQERRVHGAHKNKERTRSVHVQASQCG